MERGVMMYGVMDRGVMMYGVMDRGVMMYGVIICPQSLLFNFKYKLVQY
jgi:hypothetical protein